MDKRLFQEWMDRIEAEGLNPNSDESQKWFLDKIQEIGEQNINRREVLAQEPIAQNMLIGQMFLFFYNPIRFLRKLFPPRNTQQLGDIGAQVWGMWGLLHNLARTLPWAVRLMLGRIRRTSAAPKSPIPLRNPDGGQADHGA